MAFEVVKFQAHLQRGGIGLEEMRRLLLAYAECSDYGEIKRKAIEENLLGKTSEKIIGDMLYAFRRRFLSDHNLPPAELVAQVLKTSLPEAAKLQVLFPYFFMTDPLVERCYRSLVLPQVYNSNPTLTSKDVLAYLEELSNGHPELSKWSEKLKQRWARGFLTLLRRFGLMERHPKKNLKRMWLLPESFAFFLLWFWQKEGSLRVAINQSFWDLMQLDERGKEALLTEGQLRGWWTYQRLGVILDFQPSFANLEELVRSWAGTK